MGIKRYALSAFISEKQANGLSTAVKTLNIPKATLRRSGIFGIKQIVSPW